MNDDTTPAAPAAGESLEQQTLDRALAAREAHDALLAALRPWIDAYDAFTDLADRPAAPAAIALPSIALPPAFVRQILQLAQPNASA